MQEFTHCDCGAVCGGPDGSVYVTRWCGVVDNTTTCQGTTGDGVSIPRLGNYAVFLGKTYLDALNVMLMENKNFSHSFMEIHVINIGEASLAFCAEASPPAGGMVMKTQQWHLLSALM